MPALPIADKETLDAVLAYVDELESRLTAVRAGYLDCLNSLNTRLTDTRAVKLDLVGATGDTPGTGSIFARLAQIAGYTVQLEGYVDTLEAKVGVNTDPAGTATLFARLAQIANLMAGVAKPLGLTNVGSFSTSSSSYVTAYSTAGVGRLAWLKSSRGGGDAAGGTVKVIADGVAVETAIGDSTNFVTLLDYNDTGQGASAYDLHFKSSLEIQLKGYGPLVISWYVEKA